MMLCGSLWLHRMELGSDRVLSTLPLKPVTPSVKRTNLQGTRYSSQSVHTYFFLLSPLHPLVCPSAIALSAGPLGHPACPLGYATARLLPFDHMRYLCWLLHGRQSNCNCNCNTSGHGCLLTAPLYTVHLAPLPQLCSQHQRRRPTFLPLGFGGHRQYHLHGVLLSPGVALMSASAMAAAAGVLQPYRRTWRVPLCLDGITHGSTHGCWRISAMGVRCDQPHPDTATPWCARATSTAPCWRKLCLRRRALPSGAMASDREFHLLKQSVMSVVSRLLC